MTKQVTGADIDTIIRIIDVVVSRGAIRGDEMTMVGTIRDKLSVLLEDIKKRAEKEQTSDASEEQAGEVD